MRKTPSTLILKKVSLRDGYAEHALLQSMPEENGFMNDAYGIAYDAFPVWLQQCVDSEAGQNLPEGYVPQTIYWLYADGIPVGRAKLRHRLNDSLLRSGGHIGYGIAPQHRGKGYATAMLRMVLSEAHTLGIEQALITINTDNAASRAVTEKCGGILENIEDGHCRYWVDTSRGL